MSAINAVLLEGVYESGSGTKAPTAQPLAMARGETETVQMVVVDRSGAPKDLTGCAVQLTIRERPARAGELGAEVVSRQADIDDAPQGECSFPFAVNDTGGHAAGEYVHDVWIEEADGSRQQLVPLSRFTLLAAATLPDTLVTPLPEQAPLAQGPQGDPGPPGADGQDGAQGPPGVGFDPNDAFALELQNTLDGTVRQHIYCGPFWQSGVNLGPFAWEGVMRWSLAGYLISEGPSGIHRVLLGTTDVSGKKLSGNILSWLSGTGNTPISFGSDEVIETDRWTHAMVWLDGTATGNFIRAFVDGIMVDKVAWPANAEARSSAFSGQAGTMLYLFGSDHAMPAGLGGWVRGFDGVGKVPSFNLDAAIPIPMVPRKEYWDPNTSATIFPSQFFMHFGMPGHVVFPDMSDGYNGVWHPGQAHESGTVVFGEPSRANIPRVVKVTGPQPPWARDVTPPDNSIAPPSNPGGVLGYHAFPGRDRTYSWGELGGVDLPQLPASGVGAFESHLAGASTDASNLFGQFKHQCAVFNKVVSRQSVGYWDWSTLPADVHVRVKRKRGSFGTLQQYTGVCTQATDRGNVFVAAYHAGPSGTGCYLGYYRNGTLAWLAQAVAPNPSTFDRLGICVNRTTGRVKVTTDSNVVIDVAIPADPPPSATRHGVFSLTDGSGRTTSLWRVQELRIESAI